MMQTEGWLAAHCLCRAHALAIGASSRVAYGLRMQRAMAKEGCWPLVALLLEALRAHGSKEAVGGQRNMGPTRGGRWATLSQATSPSRRCWLRPSSLAARMRGCDRGWT